METVSQLKGRGQEIIQGSQKQGKYHIGFGTETPQSFRDFFFSPRFFSSISAVLLPHPPPYFLFPLFAFLLLKHLYKILTFTTRGDFQLETANCRFFFFFSPVCIPSKPEAAINPYKLFYSMGHIFLFYIILSDLNKLS